MKLCTYLVCLDILLFHPSYELNVRVYLALRKRQFEGISKAKRDEAWYPLKKVHLCIALFTYEVTSKPIKFTIMIYKYHRVINVFFLPFLLYKSSTFSSSSLSHTKLVTPAFTFITHASSHYIFADCFDRRLSSSTLPYVSEIHLFIPMFILNVSCFEDLWPTRPPTEIQYM